MIRTRALVTRQHELIKQMRLEMDIQAGHLKILRFENDHLRRAAVEAHSQQEAEEEQITNRLLKRIDGLKKEKSEIVSQMEVEEEHITNTLRKRLNDVSVYSNSISIKSIQQQHQMQKEKIDLEIAMEQEQEFIVNRLTRQMSELKRQQSSSANLNAGQSNEGSNLGDAEPSEELLKLRDSLAVMEAEHQRRIDDYQRIIDGLRREINRITDSENSLPMPPPATPQAASGSLNGISKK